MTFTILENLRGFFNSRPPLVVFMICLGSFAISLILFAHLVKSREIPDPDVNEDWNTMLEKFSHLQFCVPSKAISHNESMPKLKLGEKNAAEVYESIQNELSDSISDKSNEKDKSSSINKRDADRSVSTPVTVKPSASGAQLENVTVNLSFIYIPVRDGKDIESAQLVAAVTAHQLKLDVSAKVKGDEQLSVFMSFPQNLTDGVCEETDPDSGNCRQYRLPVCIVFQGPRRLLPQTQRPNMQACAARPEPLLDTSRKVLAGSLTEVTQSDWCRGGSHLLPQYTLDDSLTVFLSMHDKSAINMHLMRTSYFLFVMVVTLFAYALIKGRPTKVKAVHVAYEKVSQHA